MEYRGAVDALWVATPSEADRARPEFRGTDGRELLVQEADVSPDAESEWKVVTSQQPDDALWADLRFGWSVVRHVKSNAIVLAKGGMVVGILPHEDMSYANPYCDIIIPTGMGFSRNYVTAYSADSAIVVGGGAA